jgi:hypothetical protein
MKIDPTGTRASGIWHFGLAACALLLGGQAEAATQGSLGATSKGSIDITLSVAARVQLSGLSDVVFVAVSPDAAATRAQSVCVWSNTATRGYSVTASGSGPGGGFALADGGLTTPYAVEWSASAGQPSGTSLDPGTALTGLTTAATSPDCASGTSGLTITVASADLQQAQPQTNYAGSLNLLVSPE